VVCPNGTACWWRVTRRPVTILDIFVIFGRPSHLGWPIVTPIWLSGLESTLIVGRYGYRKANSGVGTEPRRRDGGE
jgi:hypothetical protein